MTYKILKLIEGIDIEFEQVTLFEDRIGALYFTRDMMDQFFKPPFIYNCFIFPDIILDKNSNVIMGKKVRGFIIVDNKLLNLGVGSTISLDYRDHASELIDRI